MTTQDLAAQTTRGAAPHAVASRAEARSRLSVIEEWGGLALAMTGFLVFVFPAGYSMGSLGMGLAIVTLLPALVATRCWETLTRTNAAIVGAFAGAVAVVLATTRSDHPFDAYYVLYGVLAYVLVQGFASTRRRRSGTAVVLCALAVVEAAVAWHTWVGHGNPGAPIVGTLHWWNQFAAFLLAPALVAAACYVRRSSAWLQVAAATTATVCGSAIFLSTSRAVLGLLVLGWLAIGVVALRGPDRRASLLRWASIPFFAVAATVALTNPALLGGQHYAVPLLGDGTRGASSMGTNSSARLTYVHAALRMFLDHPLVGIGFGSYARESVAYVPHPLPPTFGIYNAWVDGLATGGVVYGVPVLGAGIGVAVTLARTARRAWGLGVDRDAMLLWGIVIGTLTLFGHFAFDADTYFPALVTMAGALVGLAQAANREPGYDNRSPVGRPAGSSTS